MRDQRCAGVLRAGTGICPENEEELSDEDYPEQETEIIVQGTFETYKEPNDETLYCRITDADMQIKK